MTIFPSIQNRRGIALLNVVFLLIFIGVLIVAGLKMYEYIVTRGKLSDTKNGLESQARMAIAWAVNNKRLPASGSEFNSIYGTAPLDAWGNPVQYHPADPVAMTAIPTPPGNNICGRTSTPVYYSSPTNYVAFALLSGGGALTPGTQWPASGQLNIALGDVARIVTLNELQARAGCAGVTLGYLRIVNNELPNACAGSTTYPGILYGDGGVPTYSWTPVSLPGWLSLTSLNGTAVLSPNASITSTLGTYQVTVQLTDSQQPTATTVQRTYNLKVVNCGGSNPPGDAMHNGADSGINTSNSADPTSLSQNIVTGMSGIQVVGNLIEFGFNQGNGSACIWYPYNFPLPGKTMRAFWNFCFNNSDTSSDSTSYGDGYTFTLMQASNPTTYCGTGTPWDSVANPYYNCQYSGHFGEFLAYCGLPGQSSALEFDIYPNSGSVSRNDPAPGNYNHVAVVNAITEHNGPPLAGLYGENTHNFGGNPACGPTLQPCNGTCTGTGAKCTGTCDGASIINGTCNGTCYGTCTGTCNGTGSGCVYNGFNGDNFTIPAGHTAVTWLEDGCNGTKDNHNARVEIHTRCNNDCSQCETSSCTTKSFIKVWIDKGNNSLGSNESSLPDLSYCADLPTALNQFKVGFTQATGARNQLGYISNVMLKSYGTCSVPIISPATLPAGRSGSPYAAQVTVMGGQPSYTWTLSASNIPGVPASTLPSGLSTTLLTSGTCPGTSTPTCTNSSPCICGTPTTPNTYNTVLVSATDSCTADTCPNTTSQSYTINICSTLSITTGSPLPNGSVGTAYQTNLSASGGSSPYTWSISAGSLPPGLNLNTSNGAISGTPTTAGTYTFTAALVDSCGDNTMVSSTFSLTISSQPCTSYRVWNNTGSTYDFTAPDGSCQNNVPNGGEITTATNTLPLFGFIVRYSSSQGHCNKGIAGFISGFQASAADTNGNCQVNYNANDTLSDR